MYQIIHFHLLLRSCLHFSNKALSSIGKHNKYVNYKHLYHILWFFLKMNYNIEKFVHASNLNNDEVMQVLNP